MRISEILSSKRLDVVSIPPTSTIRSAITLMKREHVGAVLVLDADRRLLGVLSERDIVHALANHGSGLLSLTVAEVMTQPVITCDPTSSVDELMAEMTNRRIRHFPVVRNGRLCGIVSIGDVVKSRLDEIEYEAKSLRSFIAGA